MQVMQSNKWTFSLVSLVVLLAFGVFCAVPSAFADGDANKDHFDIDVTIGAGETMVDVSAEDGFQIATGRDRADRAFETGPASIITLTFTFSKGVIHLHSPETLTTGENPLTDSGDSLGLDDIVMEAFDKEGRSLGVFTVADVVSADAVGADTAALTSFADANNPGRVFLLRIDESQIANAYTAARGGSLEIYKLSFIMPQATAKKDKGRRIVNTIGVKNAALDHFGASFDPDSHAHFNKKSNVFTIDLVDDDEGDPMYSRLTSNSAAVAIGESGIPGVVSITRILDRNAFQPIETGPFNVRIILTEEPKGGLTTDLIEVMNGSATALTKGLTLKGGSTAPAQTSELTVANAGGMYATDGSDLPEATGRDNMYHQYVATITPNAGVDGYVTTSIKQFDDNVLPVPRTYVPLTASQRTATILTGDDATTGALGVRDRRLANETLMVRVKTADAPKSAVVTAYEARQKVFDGIANEAVLGAKLVVPAGGYLVVHAADLGNTGITDPKSKTKDKISAASKLYNVTKLGLPFPADDLDNFFRNGGTLNLAYADITEATGSGHDDSKGPTGDDATGYTGASTNAYAAGALIINEIMWGLDAGTKDSQYIELHNPGTTAIGIDSKEWVITVGSAPTGFTVIDTVGNNPATGFWEAPGSGGVTAVGENHPVVSDLVSMSRVTGATDGTAAASWVASERPSANLSGRRIGTPGAANQYTPAPTPTPTPPPPAPMVDVATGADIRVSEIMVASNEGRLAQWIELANVSSGEVSLNGWGITIDNDPDDADVVGARVNVELGDVTVDAEQVVLVVSKSTTRTSGVGMDEGDIREDRIVDVQDQVSDEDRYSLISEMAFKISLIPPQTSGVVEPGDVVGNLGEGWELPMSEDGRSSLIRREMDAAAMAQMGTSAAGWKLASSTMLDGAYRTTYYGDDEDVGTPGYNAGGPLPVELSSFYPKRNEETGHVEITWKTQSELNNAGFFIKRSQQRDGKFVVVNPTMIPGAGTTSEEQSYAYTDTTAQPNVVYYYQIEDVSLDGQRQTLTLGTRLRGHIGAAGKATTIWGELKSQE